MISLLPPLCLGLFSTASKSMPTDSNPSTTLNTEFCEGKPAGLEMLRCAHSKDKQAFTLLHGSSSSNFVVSTQFNYHMAAGSHLHMIREKLLSYVLSSLCFLFASVLQGIATFPLKSALLSTIKEAATARLCHKPGARLFRSRGLRGGMH